MLERIDRYEIREELGQGAMANVYHAFDPRIPRHVAVKILKQELCLDADYRRRFLSDANAAGPLTHPNIVTIHDVGEVDGRPYLVMELLEGLTLEEAMAQDEEIPLEAAVRIAIQVADALDYAHSSRPAVVHRDIKPGNIAITPGDWGVKIMDFNIARIERADAKDRTVLGTVLGTPRYMSPEQARGHPADGRSDLFSLGVVLYELITGRTAFDGDTIATLLEQIKEEEPIPISELVPETPSGLQNIVRKLMQKKPEKRFATGRQAAEALRRELRALERTTAEQKRVLPTEVKLAGLVALVLAGVMTLGATAVYRRQAAAMQEQAYEAGARLAQIISTEKAGEVGFDWYAVAVFVDEVSQQRDVLGGGGESPLLEYLVITDTDGIAYRLNETTYELEEEQYVPPRETELIRDTEELRVSIVEGSEGEDVLHVTAPVTFGAQPRGTVHLGLSTEPLVRAARLSTGLLVGMIGLAAALVGVMAFAAARRVLKSLEVVHESLDELARGHFHTRISHSRRDEMGRLYDCFNRTASAIEERSLAGDLQPEGGVGRHAWDSCCRRRGGGVAGNPGSGGGGRRGRLPGKPGAHGMRSLRNVALVVALTALGVGTAGCAWPPIARTQVLAENDDFVIVQTGSHQSLEFLAARFLGDPAQHWQIAEFNGVDEAHPGAELVIPKRPVNPTGVWTTGYQTVPVLVYHRFRVGNKSRSPMEIPQASFRAQMAHLRDEGYQVISLRKLGEFLAGRRALPRKSVVITIDDGFRSAYTIALPVLREFGFPATLFVYTDFVRGGLGVDWAALREMVASGLVDVACHSKTHANLSLRREGETEPEYRARLREEVRGPTRLLRKRLGVRSDAFSFPYGDANDDVLTVLKAEGYELALTVTRGGNASFADPYRLRRTMIYGEDGLSDFRRRLQTFRPMDARR